MESSKQTQQSVQENCLDTQKLLDPSLWKHLPNSLYHLVFAHLPINEIFCLRSLNKTWNSVVSTTSSIFSHKCDEAHPLIFSFITVESGTTTLRLVSTKHNKWYTYNIPSVDSVCNNIGGEELVCWHTERANRSHELYLLNPLTRIVQNLKVPSIPSTWKILHFEKRKNCIMINIWDMTLIWGDSNSHKILIYDLLNGNNKWKISIPNNQKSSLEVTWNSEDFEYDSNYSESNIASYGAYISSSLWRRPSIIMKWAFYEKRVYVLITTPVDSLSTTKNYSIEEFLLQGKNRNAKLVKVKVHNCHSLELFKYDNKTDNHMELYAFEGYLMIVVTTVEKQLIVKESALVYNLATCVWTTLDFPQLQPHKESIKKSIMRCKWTL